MSLFIIISIFFSAYPGWPKDGNLIKLDKVSIPKKFGQVREFYQPPFLQKRHVKTIFHIQDVHANYEAQKNLANILEYLIKNYGVGLILVEGGVTDRDFSYIRKWAPIEERRAKADNLMKEGFITGETYVDIASDFPLKFRGIEDRKLYEGNMHAYLKIDAARKEGMELIRRFKDIAENLKRYIYTKHLMEFDEIKKAYKSEKIELVGYLKYLNDAASKEGVDLQRFSNHKILIETARLEERIDFNIVEEERDELIKKINDILPKGDINEVLARALKFNENEMAPGAFYSYLRDLALRNNINIEKFKNLNNYIEYAAYYEKLKGEALFKEISKIENMLLGALCKNRAQSRLFDISHKLSILEAFLKLKVAPGDLEYYKENKDDFDLKKWSKFLGHHITRLRLGITIPKDLSAIENNLNLLETFFDTAIKRDGAFLRNSIKEMEKEKTDIAVLIAGGFHTKNLTRLFRSNDISYLVLTPKVTTNRDDRFYDRVLKESYRTRIWK